MKISEALIVNLNKVKCENKNKGEKPNSSWSASFMWKNE